MVILCLLRDASTRDAQLTEQRPRRLQVCDIWPAWGTCLQALAQNPLVILSDAGPFVLSSALQTLLKFGSAAVHECEPLHNECELAEMYFSLLVRGMCGGSTTEPGLVDFALCDAGTNAHDLMRVELSEAVARLVTRLRVARRQRMLQGSEAVAMPTATAADGTVDGTSTNEASALVTLLVGTEEALPLLQELCFHEASLRPAFFKGFRHPWGDAPQRLSPCWPSSWRRPISACVEVRPWELCALTQGALRELERRPWLLCTDGRTERAVTLSHDAQLKSDTLSEDPSAAATMVGDGALDSQHALITFAPLLAACRRQPLRVMTTLLEALWAAAHGARPGGAPLRLVRLLVLSLSGTGRPVVASLATAALRSLGAVLVCLRTGWGQVVGGGDGWVGLGGGGQETWRAGCNEGLPKNL